IERMMRDAEAHAEEDRRRREAAEARNQGEQLVHQTERLLGESGDKIPGNVKSEVEAAVAELKEKLKGEDTAAVRTAVERLSTAAQKIGSALYDRSQETTGGTGRARAQPQAEDDDVVDAEIVDEDKRGDAA
ncbi:Hsp70 family protein, partial [Streptomyces sp. CC208A]|uniref:Hsp70 family protein n=1 Tax=Streptomyces sp. CC208A TaxID=3044573 RepID=UPI0024A9DE0F